MSEPSEVDSDNVEDVTEDEPELTGRQAQLGTTTESSSELLLRLKYMQADFENYRKRTQKEMKETEENATMGLVLSLLGALDELDLAVKHSRDGSGSEEVQEGLEMVQKHLFSTLEAAGLQRIDCVGQPFDPSRHEAVAKVQGDSPGADTVVEELRPGYAFRGRVIRPSMVKVELAAREAGREGAST